MSRHALLFGLDMPPPGAFCKTPGSGPETKEVIDMRDTDRESRLESYRDNYIDRDADDDGDDPYFESAEQRQAALLKLLQEKLQRKPCRTVS